MNSNPSQCIPCNRPHCDMCGERATGFRRGTSPHILRAQGALLTRSKSVQNSRCNNVQRFKSSRRILHLALCSSLRLATVESRSFWRCSPPFHFDYLAHSPFSKFVLSRKQTNNGVSNHVSGNFTHDRAHCKTQ